MPKSTNPITKAKTSPGISYTIPASRLVDSFDFDAKSTFLLALEPAELEQFEAAAREIVAETFPDYHGTYIVPVSTFSRRTCLWIAGQFAPVIRGADGKPRERIRNGAIVTARVMLKCFQSAKGVTVYAFPSRFDIDPRPSTRKPKPPVRPVQLDMVLEAPAEPVAEPAPIAKPKPRKVAKPKPAPKAKGPVPFDKAAFAAHRKRVVEARARKAAKAQATPVTPSNVIAFPVHRTRRPGCP